jgi:hypothetical protein
MLDRIYTGRIVPEGIAGSSTDQSSIPQPRVRVQDEKKTMIIITGMSFHKQLVFPGDETLIFRKA